MGSVEEANETSMRVIVIGATGFAGRAVLQALADGKTINNVISLSDRHDPRPGTETAWPEIERREVNLTDDLSDQLRFADAVVYAGWPVTNLRCGAAGNQDVSALHNVCDSVAASGVQTFVYGSSMGAYSSAPTGQEVREDWPALGLASSSLSQQMAYGDRRVAQFAAEHPVIRVVTLRPGAIVCPTQMENGWKSRLGRKVVATLAIGQRWRFVPDLGRVLQVVHVADLALAFRLAVTESVVGSYNLAADSITPELLAQVFGARRAPVSPRHATRILSCFRHIGLHSVGSEWLELALRCPVMDTRRAQGELGWGYEHSALSILQEWHDILAAASSERTSWKEQPEGYNRCEQRRGDLEVEQRPGKALERVDRHLVGGGVCQIAVHVAEPACESIEDIVFHRLPGRLEGGPCPAAQIIFGPGLLGHADDGAVEALGRFEAVERPKGHLLGEVLSDPEDD